MEGGRRRWERRWARRRRIRVRRRERNVVVVRRGGEEVVVVGEMGGEVIVRVERGEWVGRVGCREWEWDGGSGVGGRGGIRRSVGGGRFAFAWVGVSQ